MTGFSKPPLLSEAEIEAKLARHAAEERARERLELDFARDAARTRNREERGIPEGPPFDAVVAQPWKSGLLYGETGTGKTHLAICRARSVPTSVFVTVRDLIKLARGREFDRLDEYEERRWARIHRASHLVLDDLGAPRDTPLALDTLDGLFDERWLHQAPVLATSNCTPVELRRRFPRAISRLLAFGPPEKLRGPDRRLGSRFTGVEDR